MKTLFTSLYLLNFFLNTRQATAQTNNFAPIGAKWWYDDYFNSCATWPDCGYFTLESVKDTIVAGKQCRVLAEEHFEIPIASSDHRYVVHEDSGKVYVYWNEDFHTLYDFDAEAGDTIIVFEDSFEGFFPMEGLTYDAFIYRIDSIGSINISGNDLAMQYVSTVYTGDGCGFFGKIIEQIGSPVLFFGNPTTFAPEYGSFLRCYEDESIYYNDYIHECDFLTAVSEDETEIQISIAPNPTTGILTVRNPSDKPYVFSIVNSLAQVIEINVSLDPGSEIQVNIAAYADGIFYLLLRSDTTSYSYGLVKTTH